jgi:bifunctional DNA-binding transcriptional regulator/antitoxin component of YhaV-PrlF toxin-antitoxin module
MTESTLNAKGQTTVPALIRRRFKAAIGTRLVWSVLSDGTLIVRPKTKHLQDLAGILDAPGNLRAGIDDLSR